MEPRLEQASEARTREAPESGRRRLVAGVAALSGAGLGPALVGLAPGARGDADRFAAGLLLGALLGGVALVGLAPRALALRRPRAAQLGEAAGVAALLELAHAALMAAAGRPALPTEWAAAWASAAHPAAVVLALVVAGPLFEELFFRGLLLGAWPRPGWPGVLLSAALFTAAHFPGDAVEAAGVGLAGLGYGALRVRAGGVLPAVVAHALGGAAVVARLVLA